MEWLNMSTKKVAVSGGFDPVHVGHIDLFRKASEYGKVVVLLNSDDFLMQKKGYVFMTFQERKEVLESIKYIDHVVPVIDNDMTVRKTLGSVKPDMFVNGGDRASIEDIPEYETCKENGIEMIFTGQLKRQSSSKLCSQSLPQQ